MHARVRPRTTGRSRAVQYQLDFDALLILSSPSPYMVR
jgi:hypothetical protein